MTAKNAMPGDGSPQPVRSGVAARFLDACLYCAKPARLRRTVTIAVVVGTILTLLNQGDVILGGNATGATAVKTVLNYVVPFVVANVGMLGGRGTADAGDCT